MVDSLAEDRLTNVRWMVTTPINPPTSGTIIIQFFLEEESMANAHCDQRAAEPSLAAGNPSLPAQITQKNIYTL